MKFFDALSQIKNTRQTKTVLRAAAELSYCWMLADEDAGMTDALTCAANYLCDETKRTGVLREESLYKAEETLKDFAPLAKKATLICASHAHIDMNWLWGYNETVSITLETFRTVLNLMDEYPEFIFSQSQGVCYEIAEKYDPALFEAIKKRITQGRWEVTAATWTENDKNMPNAESMARHYLYTRKYMEERCGVKPGAVRMEFQPDTFGHTAFTPDIAAKAGIEYYYHCRGRESKSNLYTWRGSSGAELLVYQDPLWYNTEHCRHLKDYEFLREIPSFCANNHVDTALLVYGVGDHGGGPTRRMLESIGFMQEFPLGPTVKMASFHDFYDAVKPLQSKFPVHEGELNFVFTGCYSSQSMIKMANRYGENKLNTAETLSSLSRAYAGGFDYSARYNKAWTDILFNQFHDILPGCGISFTREHALGIFQNSMGYTAAGSSIALNEFAAAIDTSSIDAPVLPDSDSEGAGVGFNRQRGDRFDITPAGRGSGKSRIFHVFNPCSFPRSEVIEIVIWDYEGDTARLGLFDTEGTEPPQKLTEKDVLYWSHSYSKIQAYVTVPAFGYLTLTAKERPVDGFAPIYLPDPRIQLIPDNVLENSLIYARFDKSMNLVSLIDKKSGKEMISDKAGYFLLSEHNTTIPHFAEYGDAWKEGAELRSRSLNDTERVIISKRDSGVRQSIKYQIHFLNSKLDVTVSLDHESSMLYYSVEAEWSEFFKENKYGLPALKFVLPLAYKSKEYWYQNQLGLCKRADLRHDAPARDFVYSPGSSGRGVALLSDYLYGYRCEEGVMSVTMLRASQHPDQYPEVGFRAFKLGIAVSSSTLSELYSIASRMTGELPYITNKTHKGNLPLNGHFLTLEGSVVSCALKTPEDGSKGFVMRLHETEGEKGETAVNFTVPPAEVVLTDIHENPIPGGILNGNKFVFNINPNELITLKVTTTGAF